MVGETSIEQIQILFVIEFACKIFISFYSFKQHTGNCEVDSINGVDKNIMCREAMKQVADPKRYATPLPPTCRLFLITTFLEKEIIVLLQTAKLYWKDILAMKVSNQRTRVPRERDRGTSRIVTGM